MNILIVEGLGTSTLLSTIRSCPGLRVHTRDTTASGSLIHFSSKPQFHVLGQHYYQGGECCHKRCVHNDKSKLCDIYPVIAEIRVDARLIQRELVLDAVGSAQSAAGSFITVKRTNGEGYCPIYRWNVNSHYRDGFDTRQHEQGNQAEEQGATEGSPQLI